MESVLNTTFPVYKEDQVLSHYQLNGSFNYLEEQIRITRTGLIATGIVDGLELEFTNNSVTLKKGVAVTSLGFQIEWREKTFTHIRSLELSKDFLEPILDDDNSLKNILAKSARYQAIKASTELVDDSFTEAKTPLSSAILAGKVVLVLFEMGVKQADQCDANSCDENSANVIITIRPLLISQAEADTTNANQSAQAYFQLTGDPVFIPRFDIPKTALSTRTDVVAAFQKVNSGAVPTAINAALKALYETTKTVFGHLKGFNLLNADRIEPQVSKYKNTDNGQYLYNWLQDLVQAYHEILEVGKAYHRDGVTDQFPFHVLAGPTDNALSNTQYRTGYFPAPPLARDELENFNRLEFLFKRLIHLLNNFDVSKTAIKVTPSMYGNKLLEKKAVPYYYTGEKELSRLWKPKGLPLGYKADQYAPDKNHLVKPLLYDLEAHDFYRIEGHIGTNYQDAIRSIELIREAHRLPFKVIALNAIDIRDRELAINDAEFDYSDLEVDYDIARTRVTKITGKITDWLTDHRADLVPKIMADSAVTNLINLVNSCSNLFTEDLTEFLDNYDDLKTAFDNIHYIYLVHRACIKVTDFQSEDLMDHLDQLNDLVLEDPFTVLFTEARRRYTESVKKTLFSNFYQSHTGIEPLNGTIRGGTFLLVYSDSSILVKTKPPVVKTGSLEATLEIRNYKKALSVTAEDNARFVKQIEKSNPVIKSKQVLLQRDAVIAANPDETKKIQKAAYDQMSEMLAEKLPLEYKFVVTDLWKSLENKLGILDVIPPASTDGIVFADFCLPYICCGEGDAINLVLPTVTVLPQIAISKTAFCANNPEKVEVTLTPSDLEGTFTENITSEVGKYFFKSSATEGDQKISFTSKANQKSNELTVTILPARTIPLELTTKQKANDPRECVLTINNPMAGEQYDVDFGDGTTLKNQTKTTLEHTYPAEAQSYPIKVTATIGTLCPVEGNSKYEVVPLPAPPPQPVFKLDATEFCISNNQPVEIQVDADFKLTAVQNQGNLKFEGNKPVFLPNKQVITQTTVFPLTYKGISLTITIIRPSADFELTNDAENKLIILSPKNATRVIGFLWKWDPQSEFVNRALKEQEKNKELKVPYSIILEMGNIPFSLTVVTELCGKDSVQKRLVANRQLGTFILE
ncbi:hypothetical protein [Larkinella rosea]|uniref:PKD domain-containing protein n=1 Tax=Larkinella rosea TaxID=2025312 RepID=A0A3P1C4F8_9BACT|nr:hypothetical protein [Larkinella rosea]RRB07764.1 hypothetical protein EHT25_08315 [Larkinella rosea]